MKHHAPESGQRWPESGQRRPEAIGANVGGHARQRRRGVRPLPELPGNMGSIAGFTDPAGNWVGRWQEPAKKRAAPKMAAKKPAKKPVKKPVRRPRSGVEPVLTRRREPAPSPSSRAELGGSEVERRIATVLREPG